MNPGGSPARHLLLILEDETSVLDLPLPEILEDLSALGIDPGASIMAAQKRAHSPILQQPVEAPPPPPPPIEPVRPVAPADPIEPVEPVDPMRPAEPVAAPQPPPIEPIEPVEPVAPVAARQAEPALYHTTGPSTDLMADLRVRTSDAPVEEEEKPRRRGGSAWTLLAVLAVLAAGAVVSVRVWPQLLDFDIAAVIAGLEAERPAVVAEAPPPETSSEVSVSRLEAVPPPAVETRRQPEPARPPAPAPAPQPVQPAPAPRAAAPPDPNAPINIVPKVEPAEPFQEARLPGNVDRPFSAPPAIVAFVPVDRAMLAETGTGILSSGQRSGGGPTSDERRLATRMADAERIAAGREIAAMITMQDAEGSFDAVILKRPRVEENRTIADADPVLIPILGDSAHLFDLIRLAPQ